MNYLVSSITSMFTIQPVDCGQMGWVFPGRGPLMLKIKPSAKNNAPYKVNLCFCEIEGLVQKSASFTFLVFICFICTYKICC